jgi:hypothetical protein
VFGVYERVDIVDNIIGYGCPHSIAVGDASGFVTRVNLIEVAGVEIEMV